MPTLSVVIPCRDDAALLEECLRRLAVQSVPADEVIVVDNGSTDATAEVARVFGAKVVVEPTPGIPAAAAAGYDAARGDIIARCDADSRPGASWVSQLLRHFPPDSDTAAVTGPGRFYGLPAPVSLVADLFYMGGYFVGMGAAAGHWPLFGSNMAFRRRVWLDVRDGVERKDSQVHDDVELTFALSKQHRVVLDPRLSVGVSARALRGGSAGRLRWHRAIRSLRHHWAVAPPWIRWRPKK